MDQKTTAARNIPQNHPGIEPLHYGEGRQEVLYNLRTLCHDWEFKIGTRHLGSTFFRSEFPEFEIVAEYRPALRVRSQRYAIYARRRTP